MAASAALRARWGFRALLQAAASQRARCGRLFQPQAAAGMPFRVPHLARVAPLTPGRARTRTRTRTRPTPSPPTPAPPAQPASRRLRRKMPIY